MDYQRKIQAILDHAVETGMECGCQAALYINGELAVNAYAGWTDWTRSKKVDENTVFPVYSTSKPFSATVIHRLVEAGKVSYDTRIADFWPEFGCNGKEDMRVWHVLTYRSALARMPKCPLEDELDFELMTRKMAAAAPEYQYGTKQEYHSLTYGWLTGGIACHVLNRWDYPQIFREYVGGPAGMDRFFFGISPDEDNAATLVLKPGEAPLSQKLMDRMNTPAFRQSCNPATCAMSSALSLARHYAAIDTGKIMSKETLDYAVSTRWRAADDPFKMVKGNWVIFGLGYTLYGPVENIAQTFGHGGIGGAEALLDRKTHYAIAITRNRFAYPCIMEPVYAAADFKSRDWPDSGEEAPDVLTSLNLKKNL